MSRVLNIFQVMFGKQGWNDAFVLIGFAALILAFGTSLIFGWSQADYFQIVALASFGMALIGIETIRSQNMMANAILVATMSAITIVLNMAGYDSGRFPGLQLEQLWFVPLFTGLFLMIANIDGAYVCNRCREELPLYQ